MVRILLLTTVIVMAVIGFAEAAPAVADAGMMLQVQGTARMTVPNDEAVITFTAEEQGADSKSVSNRVVARANAATRALKAFGEKVEAETADLSTWPIYKKAAEGETPAVGAWGVRETLRVTVRDVVLVCAVMEAVAKHMNYDGLVFRISEKAKKVQDEALLRAAMDDALRQAGIVAVKLGLTDDNVRIQTMQVGGRAGGGVRYYAAPALKSSVGRANTAIVRPDVSAGTSEISLSVGMEIRISK